MNDYLELLLVRRQEEEEETFALALHEPEELPVRRTARSLAPGEPEAAAELPESGPVEMAGSAIQEAVAGHTIPEAADVAGSVSAPGRLSAGRVLPEERLDRVVDALDRIHGDTERVLIPDGEVVRLSRRPEGETAGRVGRRAGDFGGGAAGLARRLSRTALASAPPPVPDLSGGVVRDAPASEGWMEFDRRLERDARCYDGGMGMY